MSARQKMPQPSRQIGMHNVQHILHDAFQAWRGRSIKDAAKGVSYLIIMYFPARATLIHVFMENRRWRMDRCLKGGQIANNQHLARNMQEGERCMQNTTRKLEGKRSDPLFRTPMVATPVLIRTLASISTQSPWGEKVTSKRRPARSLKPLFSSLIVSKLHFS